MLQLERVQRWRTSRVLFASNMALQRTRRPRLRSGRSLRSLGSPLNARSLDAAENCGAPLTGVVLPVSAPTGFRRAASSRLFPRRAGSRVWFEAA